MRCFSPKQFSCFYDVKSNVYKKRLLKRRRWNSVVSSTQCECKVSFSGFYAHSAVPRRLLPDDVNRHKHYTILRKQRGQRKPLIVHDVQEKACKQNNTEPEMAEVKKTLHKSIQVWHQSTKGLARQQLEIENYSSLMEKNTTTSCSILCFKILSICAIQR
jgi:hypothetical protein